MQRFSRVRLLAAPLAAAVLAGGALVVAATPAGAVTVSTEAELRDAWANATEITLTADITLTCANGGQADRASADPVVLDGAGHTIALEPDCISRVLNNEGDGNTTLRNVTITGGNVDDDGAGYEHDGSGSLTIENSTFADNTACDNEAGGLSVEESVPVLVTGSTFVGNRAPFDAAIDLDEGASLVMVNSTVTGNIANAHGAIAAEDAEDGSAITLVYSTIVGNIETTDECVVTGALPLNDTADEVADEQEDDEVGALEAGEPGNLVVDERYTFRAFATVIAEPIGSGPPTPNCVIADDVTVESAGYSFSDDATCGFTNVAGGDREDAGSPQVGALSSNGGPTQTRLPAVTSPLVNAIPIASCSGGDGLAGFAVTTDQRGVGRPQETGCEIGSVEIVAPVVLEPTFTG